MPQGEREFPKGGNKKSNPTHVPPGKSGLSCFGEQLSLGREGLNSPNKHNFLD